MIDLASIDPVLDSVAKPRRLGWFFTIAGGLLFVSLTFALVVASVAAGSFSADAAIVILIGVDFTCLLVLIGGIRILTARLPGVHSDETVPRVGRRSLGRVST